jgi:hypothetical protein
MRVDAAGSIPRAARFTAFTVELAAVAGSLAMIAAIVALLLAAGERETASFCVILAALLPSRLLAPLIAGKRTGGFYQALLAWTGVVLAGLVWLVSRDALWFAAALAARDWVATILAGLLGQRRAPAEDGAEKLHWREIADHSHFHGRRRFTYRVSKSLLKFVFGPFGSIAARTGRGFRVDRKLELRVGASAGNILIWSKLGRGVTEVGDEEDDDD